MIWSLGMLRAARSIAGPSWAERSGERALDLTVGVIALLAAAPVMLVIALAVRLTSRGPVLDRQLGLGLRAEPFVLLKFRTMRDKLGDSAGDSAGGSGGAQQYVGRRTAVGGFLHRWSLDELLGVDRVQRRRLAASRSPSW